MFNKRHPQTLRSGLPAPKQYSAGVPDASRHAVQRATDAASGASPPTWSGAGCSVSASGILDGEGIVSVGISGTGVSFGFAVTGIGAGAGPVAACSCGAAAAICSAIFLTANSARRTMISMSAWEYLSVPASFSIGALSSGLTPPSDRANVIMSCMLAMRIRGDCMKRKSVFPLRCSCHALSMSSWSAPIRAAILWNATASWCENSSSALAMPNTFARYGGRSVLDSVVFIVFPQHQALSELSESAPSASVGSLVLPR